MLTLDEVREGIDCVDSQMRQLFIERMELADTVAQIKAEKGDTIYKPDREATLIEKQSAGMDEALSMEYQAFLKRMIAVSRKYQYRRMLELKGGFPHVYRTKEPLCRRLVALAGEIMSDEGCSASSDAAFSNLFGTGHREEVTWETVDSYGEMSRRIHGGEADAGIGILEEVGGGVSDGLHGLLVQQGLYIYKCEIYQNQGILRKIALLGKELVVCRDHNRLKLAFVCPNTSGSLGNVLAMIADYGFNLTEIHSAPFRVESGWNYRFFVEMEVNLAKSNTQALICQLDQETEELRILGSYCCHGDFV